MEKQTKTLLAALAAILTLSATLVACHDDLEGDAKYNDDYVHFKFMLDNKGAWNEDGTPKNSTRLLAPIEMESDVKDGLPLYLHCVENSVIEFNDPVDTTATDSTALTRGQRITGEAFSSSNSHAVTTFGLYVKMSDGQEPLPITNKVERTPSSVTNTDGDTFWECEQELDFGTDPSKGWPSGATADFYGFAPFPGYDDGSNGQAECYSVNASTDEPTITFYMMPEEEKNKDILTAKQPDVTQDGKNDGVELKFQHILTAVKFNLASTNDLQYTVGVNTTTTYNIKVKSIKLKGIYAMGVAKLGTELTDANNTSYWTIDPDLTIDECTADINRTTTDVTGDTKKLINTDEHCFMVLPQTTPTGAKVKFICDLYPTSDTGYTGTPAKENIVFEANIEGKTWKAGYSYTYQISEDTERREYELHSVVDGQSTDGGAMSFNVKGGEKEFDVTSTVATTSNPTPVATSWHLEYYTSSTGWKRGLPLGFSLETGGTRVNPEDSQPGSTSATTYKIIAGPHLEENSVVRQLENQYYGDDWYDLSTHGYGYGAGQTARSTANCYVVQGWGNFKIPLVYGNAIKKGVTNKIAFGKTWNQDNSGNNYDRADGWSNSTHYGGAVVHYPNNRGIFRNMDGNDIVNPYINADVGRAAATAEITWEDEDFVLPGSLEIETTSESISTTDDGPINGSQNVKQYLKFKISQESVHTGNCLLSVKDASGNIMWSWHIWVTERDIVGETVHLSQNVNGTTYSFDVSPINLGWRVPDVVNSKTEGTVLIKVVQDDSAGHEIPHTLTQGTGVLANGGSNVIYMFGKKDPYPNSAPKVDETSLVFDEQGRVTDIDYSLTDVFKNKGFTLEGTSGRTMADCIKNPKYFCSTTGNWFTEFGVTTTNNQVYMCWNINDSPTTAGYGSAKGRLAVGDITENMYEGLTKTIHDPCPVGFVVPNFGLVTMLQNVSGGWVKKTTQELDGIEIKTPIPYLYNAATGLRFYLNGCRRLRYTANGDKDENKDPVSSNSWGLTEFEENGYLHTGMAFGKGTYSAYIKINGSTSTLDAPGTTQWAVSRGFAIRPVKDSQEEVEVMPGTKRKFVRQVDVPGVELSEIVDTHLNARSLLGLVTEYAETWGISSIITNADFNRSVTIDGTALTTSLNTIIGNGDYKEKKIYLSNVRVYYTYDDPVVAGRTTTPLRVRIDPAPMYDAESHYKRAFVPTSEIGTWDDTEGCYYHDFTPNWTRYRLENTSSDLSDWSQIMPFDWLHNVTVKKVFVDIRMTYLETEP